MTLQTALTACRFFFPDCEEPILSLVGNGNINDTWRADFGDRPAVLLQRLNPAVFPDPSLVTDNLETITCHCRAALTAGDHAGALTFFSVLKNPAGANRYWDDEGALWRILTFIPDSTARTTIETPQQAGQLGKGLGVFHRLLRDLDPARIADPLPGFHETPRYLQGYDQAAAARNLPAYCARSRFCYDFILSRRSLADVLGQRVDRLRRQIVHGDPKVANFLFDRHGDRVISVIDLDTVRPGLLLHDIGDALRSCCNPAGETMSAPETAVFEQSFFAAWLESYLEEAGFLLTEQDKLLIVTAILVIGYELGLRFFTDYLLGDRYFKTRYPAHNLDRAVGQFSLAADIEQKREALEETVRTLTA